MHPLYYPRRNIAAGAAEATYYTSEAEWLALDPTPHQSSGTSSGRSLCGQPVARSSRFEAHHNLLTHQNPRGRTLPQRRRRKQALALPITISKPQSSSRYVMQCSKPASFSIARFATNVVSSLVIFERSRLAATLHHPNTNWLSSYEP